MNEAQYRLYWREWKKVRTWLIQHGRTPAEADEMRGTLTEKKLGYKKSMSNWGTWTNAEVDKVLAAFRAISDGGNIDAQMAAEEQPAARKMRLQSAVFEVAEKIWPMQGAVDPLYQRERKVNFVCLRVCKMRWDSLSDVQLARILGVLKRQLERIQERETERVEAADKYADNTPF